MVLLVAGCAPNESSALGVAFPRYTPRNAALLALNEGRLVERNGCLVLDAPGGPWMLLWPSSLSLGNEAGQLVITDQASRVVASVGDEVTVGGGEFRDDKHAMDLANGGLPERCRTGLYWQVTRIEALAGAKIFMIVERLPGVPR